MEKGRLAKGALFNFLECGQRAAERWKLMQEISFGLSREQIERTTSNLEPLNLINLHPARFLARL